MVNYGACYLGGGHHTEVVHDVVWVLLPNLADEQSPWCLVPNPLGWPWAHTSHLNTHTQTAKQKVISMPHKVVSQFQNPNLKKVKGSRSSLNGTRTRV